MMWSSVKLAQNAAPATKNLGMMAPISTAGPEPKDLQLTQQLEEALRSVETENEVLLFF